MHNKCTNVSPRLTVKECRKSVSVWRTFAGKSGTFITHSVASGQVFYATL